MVFAIGNARIKDTYLIESYHRMHLTGQGVCIQVYPAVPIAEKVVVLSEHPIGTCRYLAGCLGKKLIILHRQIIVLLRIFIGSKDVAELCCLKFAVEIRSHFVLYHRCGGGEGKELLSFINYISALKGKRLL